MLRVCHDALQERHLFRAACHTRVPFSPMDCSAQVWRTAHHRAAKGALGRQTALVHTGFYRAWVANGLHLQVIEHMQVTVAPLPASCPSEMFHLPVVVS